MPPPQPVAMPVPIPIWMYKNNGMTFCVTFVMFVDEPKIPIQSLFYSPFRTQNQKKTPIGEIGAEKCFIGIWVQALGLEDPVPFACLIVSHGLPPVLLFSVLCFGWLLSVVSSFSPSSPTLVISPVLVISCFSSFRSLWLFRPVRPPLLMRLPLIRRVRLRRRLPAFPRRVALLLFVNR